MSKEDQLVGQAATSNAATKKEKKKKVKVNTDAMDVDSPVKESKGKKRPREENAADDVKADTKDKKKKKRKERKSDDEEEEAVKTGVDANVDNDSDNKRDKKKTKDRKEKKKEEKKKTAHAVKENEAKVSDVEEEQQVKHKMTKSNNKKDKKEAPRDEWSYKQDKSLSDLPQATVDDFYTKHTVKISDNATSLRPILEFSQAGFPSDLAKDLSRFPKPTVIQSACWPFILSGEDLIGVAATGSGKTLAFGIPALIHIRNRVARQNVQPRKPQVLVLSPTRELAMQIQEQVEKFSGSLAKSVVIYGGVPKFEQKKALKSGAVNVIVATPGRLIDLLEDEDGCCDLSDVSFLVLDEADRMLDLGFEEAIRKIVGQLRKEGRQTVMFSATWPPAIQKIAEQYLKSPVNITVGSQKLSANSSIEQRVEVVDTHNKESRLIELLRRYHKSRENRILIFALYKKEAARLEAFVRRNGFKVAAIHGDLGQQQRTKAIENFKKGTCPLLIATDVAARGIDIPNVEYVINVTFPLTVEDYCHRIGRTGRAGKRGISHTFFTLHDKSHSGALINVLKGAGQTVPAELLKFGTTVKKKVDPNYGAFVKDVDMNKKGKKITFNDSDSE
ncbi:hypothetical protein SpCBS45565_g02639 [Spizellomyces sp. 'palustris']|nr:hypothetical protein SpCBS45565_g02639 [Spizellomyces sp. 'palustris']